MTATAATQDTTSQAKPMAPAIVRPSVRRHSIKVELCTPAIGAELSNISLADAALDPDAIAEIRALWLKHKVLFFRDQNISPMEQQNFAAQFAELEAHPLAPSHPEADKLLMLYRNLDPSKPKASSKRSAAKTSGMPMSPSRRRRPAARCCAANWVRRPAETPCGPTW